MRIPGFLKPKTHAGGTAPGAADTARWAETARTRPGWDMRNVAMSAHVRPGDTVFDFGAGARTVREMIPGNCTYRPIDCVASDPSVFVVDFNLGFSLPEERPTCLYLSGFLEYLDDLPGFLTALRTRLPGTFAVLSYAWEIEDAQRRAAAGWRNHLGSLEATAAALSLHVEHLRQVGSHGKAGGRQAIFTGTLRPAG